MKRRAQAKLTTPRTRPPARTRVGYQQPTTRPLTVYAFDPTLGRKLSNYMTIEVPYEDLEPGPVGRKLAVIDYDISNDCLYQPADLDNPYVLMSGGFQPTEGDPRFHQQMVYAIASETIRRFEFGLGREVSWNRLPGTRVPCGDRLRLFPHAFQQANAFYDAERAAIFFGYFAASSQDAGNNVPGQIIYTCLSHDIIAHETTHALIDSVRPHYAEATSEDTPAFHEAFADIVALLQHFSMHDAVLDTIQRTGGLLYRPSLNAVVSSDKPLIGAELTENNPLVGLAQQFGEAMGMRKALRSALGTPPDAKLLADLFEPHLRGAILVAAVFDAYFSIYLKRTRDLMRLAGLNPAAGTATELHPDLAARLAREATKSASHVLNMCIRALDYCPPVDIQFGEFLRAVVTADIDLVPDDRMGYRAEFVSAFRSRGIVPESVISFSEESLRWSTPEDLGQSPRRCAGLQFDVLRGGSETSRKSNLARAATNEAVLQDYASNRQNAKLLGLCPPRRPNDPGIRLESFEALHRIGPNGQMDVNLVVQFIQERTVAVDPDHPAETFTFRGGTTVVFDHGGNVRYAVRKSLDNAARLARQRAYQSRFGESSAHAVYDPGELEKINFALVHRGC